MNDINLINVKINTISTIIIVTTLEMVVTEEAVEAKNSSMGDKFAAEKKVTTILIVGTTHRMLDKVHHIIRKMESTVRKLDWKARITLKYYCAK